MKAKTLNDIGTGTGTGTGTQIMTLLGILHPSSFLGNGGEGFYHG